MFDTPWSRLEALVALSGLSARHIDRLAQRTEGQLALIIARRQLALRADVAASYARALGCTVGYLVAGEGDPPGDAAIRAAVERAEADLRDDAPTAAHRGAA